MYPGKFVCGERAAVRRQTGRDSSAIRRSGLTPSGVQGAASGATGETDGTTTACAGHWYTTPAQVKTEKPHDICNQKK
ncbi:hypothetical protein ECZU24_58170 [Escherichia coli]|nr:hypothetical protein ECZU24_58170 [Escherichia coli]